MEFDEAGFVHYLLYDVLVHKGTEVYYSYWVKQFIREFDEEAGGWQVQLSRYLENMRNDDEFLEWQAEQAERAIRTYFSGFLKQQLTVMEAGEVLTPVDEVVLDVDTLVEKFRSLLRMQKCGAHTEKIYAGWVKEYLEFQLSYAPKKACSKKSWRKGSPDFSKSWFPRRILCNLTANRPLARCRFFSG